MDMSMISGFNPGQHFGGAKKLQQPQNAGSPQGVKPTQHLQAPHEMNKNKEMAASQFNPMQAQRLNITG